MTQAIQFLKFMAAFAPFHRNPGWLSRVTDEFIAVRQERLTVKGMGADILLGSLDGVGGWADDAAGGKQI